MASAPAAEVLFVELLVPPLINTLLVTPVMLSNLASSRLWLERVLSLLTISFSRVVMLF